MTVWDHGGWNANEWFVLGFTLLGFGLVWLLPRRFTRSASTLFVLFGAYFGVLFDHAIAVEPFDFYDVNDTSAFTFMDFVTYVMYGPFGYVFLYIYDRLGLPKRWAPAYILVWTAFAIALEGWGAKLGVFHYKNGYEFDYSSSVYLTLQICMLGLYYGMRRGRTPNAK
ncbi:hypothetical protein MO973_26585 [Paenibacillus sp. TRM 82003]|nr:hypothetical protein [Paenibacillus sp. TRM 82003]